MQRVEVEGSSVNLLKVRGYVLAEENAHFRDRSSVLKESSKIDVCVLQDLRQEAPRPREHLKSLVEEIELEPLSSSSILLVRDVGSEGGNENGDQFPEVDFREKRSHLSRSVEALCEILQPAREVLDGDGNSGGLKLLAAPNLLCEATDEIPTRCCW